MWVYLCICGCIEKYHICGLKVGVHIICGYLRYVFLRWLIAAVQKAKNLNTRVVP